MLSATGGRAETRTIPLFGVFAAAALRAAVPVVNQHPLRAAQRNRASLLAQKRRTAGTPVFRPAPAARSAAEPRVAAGAEARTRPDDVGLRARCCRRRTRGPASPSALDRASLRTPVCLGAWARGDQQCSGAGRSRDHHCAPLEHLVSSRSPAPRGGLPGRRNSPVPHRPVACCYQHIKRIQIRSASISRSEFSMSRGVTANYNRPPSR